MRTEDSEVVLSRWFELDVDSRSKVQDRLEDLDF